MNGIFVLCSFNISLTVIVLISVPFILLILEALLSSKVSSNFTIFSELTGEFELA